MSQRTAALAVKRGKIGPDGVCEPANAVAKSGLPLVASAAGEAAPIPAGIDGSDRADLWCLAGLGIAASLLLATWTTNGSEAPIRTAAVTARDARMAVITPDNRTIPAAPRAEPFPPLLTPTLIHR